MTLIRAQVWMVGDSTLPRDRAINVLHFNRRDAAGALAPVDWTALATDLGAIFQTNWTGATPAREIGVRLYNLDDPEPRAPHAENIRNALAAPASSIPRELAVCLSFYSERNIPRNRGRIYLPFFARGLTSVGLRPGPSERSQGIAIANGLSGLGGVDVDWCVLSRVDNVMRKVSNAWVDDEWDIIRKRGLRATTRQSATVSG